jgi:hypothetical protein
VREIVGPVVVGYPPAIVAQLLTLKLLVDAIERPALKLSSKRELLLALERIEITACMHHPIA